MKKGMADTNKQLFWTIFLLPAIMMFAYLIFFTVPEITNIKAQLGPSLQDHILIEKVLGNKECLAYEKEGLVLSGYIDLKKYNEEILISCMENVVEINKQVSLLLVYEDNKKELVSKNFQAQRSTNRYKKPVIVVQDEKKYNAVLDIVISK